MNGSSRIFKKIRRQYGIYALSIASFFEAIFFPIPVEFFLIPLILRHKENTFFYAFCATFFSVLGGVVGYFIGLFLTDWVMQFLDTINYLGYFGHAKLFYARFGDLALFLAAFTPIPFKVFSILSGVLEMSIIHFIFFSVLGRGLRFFLIALVVNYFGKTVYERFEKKFWWVVFALIFLIYLIFKFI